MALGWSLGLAAWVVAYLAAALLGFVWMRTWDLGILGPPAAFGVAGAIGGLFSSTRPGRTSLASAALLGLAFLLFAAIGFYAGAILGYLYSPIARLVGDVAAKPVIWGLPLALCGLGAGFAARRILGGKYTPGQDEVKTNRG